MITKRDRIIGGIMGVVVGDALGLPVQFMSRNDVRREPVEGMIGHGTFNLPPGSWSDDSSLTLCLAESLTQKGYSPPDIRDKFIGWLTKGYMTPYGYAYDMGGTTMMAIRQIQKYADIRQGPSREEDNGNGALMRILPAALYFADDPQMVQKVGRLSAMTHGHMRSQIACGFYSVMAGLILQGMGVWDAYDGAVEAFTAYFKAKPEERPHFERILSGCLGELGDTQLKSTGYVIDSLEAAIWCVLQNDNYSETVLQAVNLGGDTDTIAAIAGGLAGVAYGVQDIPDKWIKCLAKSDEVVKIARNFASACCVTE